MVESARFRGSAAAGSGSMAVRVSSWPHVLLETERLLLEPVVEAHAEVLFGDLRERRLYRFMKQVRPRRLRDLRAWFHDVASCASLEAGVLQLVWAPRERTDGRHVGLFEVTLRDGLADLGYLIFAHCWRRGYAVEAGQRVLEHLFEDHDVRRVAAVTTIGNVAGRAVATRLGFRPISAGAASCRGADGDMIRYVLDAPRN